MTKTPRQPGLTNDELPEYFNAADKAAIQSQGRYYGLLRVELVGLVLAAALEVGLQPFGTKLVGALDRLGIHAGDITIPGRTISAGQVNLAVATGTIPVAIMLVVAGCVLARYFWHPDVQWRRQRALAESVAGLAWRYAMRALPSEMPDAPPGSPQGADAFAEEFNRLVDEAQGVDVPPPGLASRQITQRMQDLRAITNLEKLRRTYVDGRIKDQQKFYHARAQPFWRRRNWLRVGIVAAYILAGGAALVLPGRGLTVFTTAAASLASWLGARQYDDLSQSYGSLDRKLAAIVVQAESLPLLGQSGADRWLRFVDEVETLLEGEHRQWLVRNPRHA